MYNPSLSLSWSSVVKAGMRIVLDTGTLTLHFYSSLPYFPYPVVSESWFSILRSRPSRRWGSWRSRWYKIMRRRPLASTSSTSSAWVASLRPRLRPRDSQWISLWPALRSTQMATWKTGIWRVEVLIFWPSYGSITTLIRYYYAQNRSTITLRWEYTM